ncbi:hypothetical protein ACTXT7_009291, partial [Hymenolepis weldensis]
AFKFISPAPQNPGRPRLVLKPLVPFATRSSFSFFFIPNCPFIQPRSWSSHSRKAFVSSIFVIPTITTHAGQLRDPTLPDHPISSSARSHHFLSLSLSLVSILVVASLNTFLV